MIGHKIIPVNMLSRRPSWGRSWHLAYDLGKDVPFAKEIIEMYERPEHNGIEVSFTYDFNKCMARIGGPDRDW